MNINTPFVPNLAPPGAGGSGAYLPGTITSLPGATTMTVLLDGAVTSVNAHPVKRFREVAQFSRCWCVAGPGNVLLMVGFIDPAPPVYWRDMTSLLVNSWTSFPVANPGDPNHWAGPALTVMDDGFIKMRGLVNNASTSGATIFVIPTAYQPDKPHMFATVTGPATSRIDVYGSTSSVPGAIQLAGYGTGGNAGYVSLDPIHYSLTS